MRSLWIRLTIVAFIFHNACHPKEEINPDPGITAIPCFTAPDTTNGRIIAGQYLVTYRNDSVTTTRFSAGRLVASSGALFSRYGISHKAIKSTFLGIQRGVVCELSPKQALALRQAPEVEFVEPDRMVSIAACITVVDTSTLGWGVRRIGYADGTDRTAWIIDSGIDSDHPDLNVDLGRSRSFIEGQPSIEDQNGHGTHVAGIIGAKNNRIGTLGVASGATLVAIRVLDQLGDGRISTVVKALNYVSQNARRGDVVNMSLVGDTISQILDQEVIGIANKGILFAIAAGNNAKDVASISPSRVNHPNVYTVSAMDAADIWAPFSNFGKNIVDVAAPGVAILSTSLDGTYAYMSGTSLATPHITGLLLLDGRNMATSGVVKGDPDGMPDPIATKK